MKHKLLPYITLLSLAIPLVTTVACGSSWRKWEPQKNQHVGEQDAHKTNSPSDNYDTNGHSNDNTNVSTTPTGMDDKLWKTRPLNVIKQAAWDDASATIDLTKVNNQFELNMLLIDAVALKAPIDIEQYWARAQWPTFAQYISSIKDKCQVNLAFNGQKTTATWDLTAAKQAIIAGLTGNSPQMVDLETNQQKYIANTASGLTLTKDGFDIAASAAVNLIGIPIVKYLTSIDLDYAGNKMAMLVNLPRVAFGAFSDMMNAIGSFVNPLFNVDSKDAFVDQTIATWVKTSGLDTKLNIHQLAVPLRHAEGAIQGAFLLQALSHHYDTLK